MESYVTNTETLYPSKTQFDSTIVRLYVRDEDHEAKTVSIKGYKPHFYAERDDAEEVRPADHEYLEGYEETDTLPLRDRFAAEDPWRDERDLVKVIAAHPGAVPDLRKQFETTWAADTIFTERFRVDSEIRTGVRVPDHYETEDGHYVVDDWTDLEPVEMTDVEPRVVTLDIETDDRDTGFPEPGEARILSIVAHDNYSDDTIAWLDLDGRSLREHFDLNGLQKAKLAKDDLGLDDLGVEGIDGLETEQDERMMLINFASWVDDVNPDLICGWNSGDESTDGFDLPHIIERMNRKGCSPERLARERKIETKYGEVEIGGRNAYDLMDGWEDTKFTDPRSSRLEDVAQEELDEGKIPHQDMGYYEMYREDPVKFLNYNAKDVNLTVEINEVANVLGFKKRLKDMTGVDWDRTHENNEFIEMSVRRKCHEHNLAVITKYDNPHTAYGEDSNDEVNYEGAYVFPSFNGIKRNVVGIDLASLYPMTQWMLNASPDTRIDRAKAAIHDIPHVVAENGQTFRIDHDGIIRELVDEYREIKREFKAKRNSAEYGTDEWDEYAEAYNVTKTIYNSYYGYSGWDKSPLYNPEDAAAITLTGQRVIKRTAEYVNEETAGEVVYGDTDSTYVQWPEEWSQEETLERVEEVCATLDNEVYPELGEEEFMIPAEDNRWEIEPEMRTERFIMWGSKKNYAYLKTWDEGDDFDEVVGEGKENEDLELPFDVPDTHGKFDVTGAHCVKSNFSLLTKNTQEDILEGAVRGADKEKLAQRAFEGAQRIDPTDPDWEYIGIPQGLGQEIDREKAMEDRGKVKDDKEYPNVVSWSTSGDHPKRETPRAAWFSNHLLDVQFGEGDKPMRAKLKPTHSVNGEEVDVIAYEDEHDLDTADEEFRIDAAEMQRKCLENPMEDIFACMDMELAPALRGEAQSQASLGAF